MFTKRLYTFAMFTGQLMMRPKANVGPILAKSANHAINSQRRSDGGMLSGLEVIVELPQLSHAHRYTDKGKYQS